ncbi:fumarylacetoacetate hydrolase family protein [Granulicoccus sp. GXG6511]|uniref:fumarylacetoacetate hydrolase family protein n=1 Tax=Granulicoccus sp. GXG6511 TaxID=3381351 RepID=UPI003D7D5183
MRIANVADRAHLVLPAGDGTDRLLDIAEISEQRFGPSLSALYDAWDEFRSWADDASFDAEAGLPVDRTALQAPSPRPRQVFAIGLNYDEHAAESGFEPPTDLPPVFTKYVSAFTGPDTEVQIPSGGNVDWEVELVVVIGRQAHRIDEDSAWGHVAGVTIGQDLSERITQLRGPAPQFGLGKSYPGFAPQGPYLVTPNELPDRDDLEIGCRIDDEVVQCGRTKEMIFNVPALIAKISENVTLYPGDIIFTGTPAGVGLGRTPQRFLVAGETLHTWIEGIGEMTQRFV